MRTSDFVAVVTLFTTMNLKTWWQVFVIDTYVLKYFKLKCFKLKIPIKLKISKTSG